MLPNENDITIEQYNIKFSLTQFFPSQLKKEEKTTW